MRDHGWRVWSKCFLWVLFLLLAGSMVSDAWGVRAKSCGGKSKTKAKPQRRKAGESFPPLPLPATPLRRSERKRPPAPPALISKVAYGKIVRDPKTGEVYRDWTSNPNDVRKLLDWFRSQLGISYRSVGTEFEKFSYDPTEIPILYLTGHEGFEFTDEIRQKLRRFLLDGGYLLGDACCGEKAFADSFRAEMAKIFPRRPLFRMAQDHPLFNAYYTLDKVRFMAGGREPWRAPPVLEGVNVGCRTAVIFSPYDLSCGWDGRYHEGVARVWSDDKPNDAQKIGANMLTYMLANYQVGRYLAVEKVFYQKDLENKDEFVVAQVVHQGDWDPRPGALINLLRYLDSNSTMKVQFKRDVVDLRQASAFEQPVLYMTGHRDFVLSDDEVASLRRYLADGGTLVGSSCGGRKAFDRAFRRELAKVLPDRPLKLLPLDHPVFSSLYDITTVQYTPLLAQKKPDLNVPVLEGVEVDGVLAVIYSRYDLNEGWDGFARPYSEGFASDDALRLGLNVLVYSLTH